jgi:hypothetical protein
MKKIFEFLLLPVFLAGCTSITNLAPSRCVRDPSGYCRVEAQWRTHRQVVRPDSIKPLVVVGFDTYPMRPVAVVQDRWEGYIPIPKDKDTIYYHYKFDFMEDAFGKPRPNSLMSRDYKMRILEQK